MRRIKIFAMIVTIGFIVLIVGIRLLHLVASDNERERFPAPGDVVNINDANMHVYSEGKGETTIVFMSGGGTQAPTIDFKPLWSLLTDEYRIAVVEKPGYGWSAESDSPRTVEQMVAEMREALRLSGHRRRMCWHPTPCLVLKHFTMHLFILKKCKRLSVLILPYQRAMSNCRYRAQ
ncbi:alpha/beta fold hydrolase [Geomicrobium sp. JCM 19055]|uniref:alpha/beta fold hydrolase n=1 Tax=Geomicrobium sp. JCM 19055 TaxID=1460649 RepID=UPI0012686B8E|nr:alpha/beta hydrolase [Geomicrobium sp. JCM 19055]